ncbi:11583_t:CDS:1, partial [Racocetra persica]
LVLEPWVGNNLLEDTTLGPKVGKNCREDPRTDDSLLNHGAGDCCCKGMINED